MERSPLSKLSPSNAVKGRDSSVIGIKHPTQALERSTQLRTEQDLNSVAHRSHGDADSGRTRGTKARWEWERYLCILPGEGMGS